MVKKLSARHWFLIVITFCVFTIYAFYIDSFGPNATVMMNFYQIDSSQQGFILTVQSIGGLAASVFLALMGERFNKIYVVGAGTCIMGAASVCIGFAPSYTVLILLVAAAGIGFTCVDIMVNGVIADTYPDRKNTLLPITHAFYGVGAMIAPLFVAGTVNPQVYSSFSVPFLWIGIAALIIFLLYILSGRFVMKDTPYAHMEEMKKCACENPAEIFKTGGAWLLLVICFFQFAFQFGISTWLPTYCIEARGMAFEEAGLLLSGFFGGALVMRFLGPAILRRISAANLFSWFIVAAAVCMALALSVPGIPVMIVLIIAAGFFQGSNAVALVIMCCAVYPNRTASASAVTVFAVNIATMTVPLLIGEIAKHVGFQLPLYLVCALMVIPFVLTRYLIKQHKSLQTIG
ncbi:MAG: MFS transporter [Christensenella sp.]|uniref:MFS transporter n=1 Tax=Christensenella sp. TaxID=1935934 RepID=UPI002B21FEFE|nr:MFS transporter [Christensenella sp.]MEA5003327.1 MFS transporter [Christensenella sp.]